MIVTSVYDARLHRERMCIGWNEVAEDYQNITVPFLAQYLPKVIEKADLNPNLNVLDVGAGTGLAAIEASEHIKPDGRVLATDFSDDMLNIIRNSIDTKNITNIDVYVMPAEELDIDSDTFDRIICNFGLSFFQEPKKALSEMYRVLIKDGVLALSTWSSSDKCLVLGLMDTILKDCVPGLEDTDSPSVFDFGQEDVLKASLENAGFSDVDVQKEVHTARYKKAGDYWDKLYRTGPELREILSDMTEEKVKKIRSRVCDEVEKYRDGEKIILPSEALIASGRK